jgi:sirohydrochlorin ferrochelatase
VNVATNESKKGPGLILFGHGARDERWREPFDRLLSIVAERYPGPVSLAFLDSMSPDLVSACQELVARVSSASLLCRYSSVREGMSGQICRH